MARGFIDGEYEDNEIRGLGLVAGVRGYGKTCELVRLLNGCTGRVWFFDTLGTHGNLFKAPTVSQPDQLRKLVNARRVRYVPTSGDMADHFRRVCALARAVGNLVLGADELDNFCDSSWGPKRMPPELNAIVQYGRHFRVAMLGVTRVPQEVARGYRSQCERFLMFHTDDPDHLEALAKFCGQDIAAKLPSLPKYRYLQWQKGISGAQMKGKVRKV